MVRIANARRLNAHRELSAGQRVGTYRDGRLSPHGAVTLVRHRFLTGLGAWIFTNNTSLRQRIRASPPLPDPYQLLLWRRRPMFSDTYCITAAEQRLLLLHARGAVLREYAHCRRLDVSRLYVVDGTCPLRRSLAGHLEPCFDITSRQQEPECPETRRGAWLDLQQACCLGEPGVDTLCSDDSPRLIGRGGSIVGAGTRSRSPSPTITIEMISRNPPLRCLLNVYQDSKTLDSVDSSSNTSNPKRAFDIE